MLKYLLSILVLVIAVITGLGDANASDQSGVRMKISQELVKNGDVALKDGDAFNALHIFESALVSDPKNVSAYIGLGRAHAALDRKKTAMDYYALALDIDPNSTYALELQSLGFLEEGKITAAERNLTRLKRLCAKGCEALEHVDHALGETLKKTQEAVLNSSEQQAQADMKDQVQQAQN
ncbi:MAG: tetratricopeptide repeat protein [Sphingomonadales bacterium]|jgi:tetratricopeptide (TPR) repeat protein